MYAKLGGNLEDSVLSKRVEIGTASRIFSFSLEPGNRRNKW